MNNLIKKIKSDELLTSIKPYLQGVEAYIVGGYVRDLLLGKENFDRDIVIADSDVKKIAQKISQNLDGTLIELDNEWEIYRIVLRDKTNYIDIAKAVNDNIKDDLARRDLTFNAIALKLNDLSVIDNHGGIADLKNKIIRGISEKNFEDDPLRLLRVFRFQAGLGFEIEPETFDYVKKHALEISKPAKERVNVELVKLFEGGFTDTALLNADRAGILEAVFPIVKEVKKIPPNTHHHLPLFDHVIETTRQIEKNFRPLPDEAKEILNASPFGGAKKLAYLKLSAFLHDIGKPQTWIIEEKTGRHRFIKHDYLGAKLAAPMLRELKFSKKQISYVQKMIKNHILPSQLDINNEKSLIRFFRKMEDNVVDLVLLAMSDRLSAQGAAVTKEMTEKNLANLNYILKRYLEEKENIKPLPKLVSGTEVMEILNIPASPRLGKIINLLKEAQISGDVNTKEEAIDFLKSMFAKP